MKTQQAGETAVTYHCQTSKVATNCEFKMDFLSLQVSIFLFGCVVIVLLIIAVIINITFKIPRS